MAAIEGHISDGSRIVREIREDDGTTGGRRVFIDSNGRRWVRSIFTRETAPTGMTLATVRSDGSIWL